VPFAVVARVLSSTRPSKPVVSQSTLHGAAVSVPTSLPSASSVRLVTADMSSPWAGWNVTGVTPDT
jgi:hypothetical protein